jgi:hypothetical protein
MRTSVARELARETTPAGLDTQQLSDHRETIAQGVHKAILEPDKNEIYAAYTLIRENLHTNDSGRTR